MAKFNVNDEVIVTATGEKGIVMAKETTAATDGNKKHVTIQYMVKVGEGFSNWKVFYRRELQKVTKESNDVKNPYIVKVYDAPNGFKVTLVALAEKFDFYIPEYAVYDEDDFSYEDVHHKGKKLNIGYSIYNPSDVYDEKLGISVAKKRLYESPFAHMSSEFSGEFNTETIDAIMDVKAKYLINNLEKFINK